MKKGLIGILIVIGVLVLLAGTLFSRFNTMVRLEENVNMSLSQIDNQLQRRNDLIPNLVETVKGYAAQEREIFESVSEARSKLIGAGSTAEKAAADQELTGSLSRLLAISESYPDLKSDANFRQLSDELAGTENRIAFARQDYNSAVRDYNEKRNQLPMRFFASAFGFEKADYFEAAPGAEAVPTVNFGN